MPKENDQVTKNFKSQGFVSRVNCDIPCTVGHPEEEVRCNLTCVTVLMKMLPARVTAWPICPIAGNLVLMEYGLMEGSGSVGGRVKFVAFQLSPAIRYTLTIPVGAAQWGPLLLTLTSKRCCLQSQSG